MIWVFPYTLGRLKKERDLILLALVFVAYVLVVNAFWFAHTYSSSFLWNSSYYCYNFALFFFVTAIAKEFANEFSSMTRLGIGVGIAMQVLVISFDLGPQHPSGAIGTFTNPNQLGYWAIAWLAAFLVLQGRKRLGLSDCLIVGGSVFLVTASLSRAAMIALAALLSAGLAFQRIEARAWLFFGAASCATFFIALAGAQLFGEERLWDKAVTELSRESLYDSLSARGYDRIWRFEEYLLFGAGEGAYERFSVSPHYFLNELHSAFGNMLFSYGVVGLAIFAGFVVAVFRVVSWRVGVYSVPVLLFGVAHNSFRFSAFWIFLGLVHAARGTTVRRPSLKDPAMVQNIGMVRAYFTERRIEHLKEGLARRVGRGTRTAGVAEYCKASPTRSCFPGILGLGDAQQRAGRRTSGVASQDHRREVLVADRVEGGS
jgi:hypothetical protein